MLPALNHVCCLLQSFNLGELFMSAADLNRLAQEHNQQYTCARRACSCRRCCPAPKQCRTAMNSASASCPTSLQLSLCAT